MSAPRVNGTFISEKVSRVRWVPEQYTAPDSFLTGSWECRDSAVKLWRLTADADFGNAGTAAGGASTLDTASEVGDGAGGSLVPKCVAKCPVGGDITGLEFVDAEHIVCSSSLGHCSLLHLNRHASRDNLREQHRFRQLHKFAGGEACGPEAPAAAAASCTAIATFEHQVVSVGEDGRLQVLALNANPPRLVRTYEAADSCTLTAVAIVSPSEVFAGNRMGTVRVFDLRAPGDRPQAAMLIACDEERKANGVTALAYHPTQRHILLAGSEEGSLTVWDLRQPGYAASYLTAHDTAITELAFHPTAPQRLFTAAEGGELFQWSHAEGGVGGATRVPLPMADGGAEGRDAADAANPWLSGERIKNKINWSPLISGIRKAINTFDAAGPRIICGCDNEAVYLVENVY